MTAEFGRLSSTFYKLERPFGDGTGFEVYEFHTVVNGNRYYTSLEEWDDHTWKCNGSRRMLPFGEAGKEIGNEWYNKLKQVGFNFAGIWEMDVCGNKRRKAV